MRLLYRKQCLPSPQGYVADYMAAVDRTESFGLKAPLRLKHPKRL